MCKKIHKWFIFSNKNLFSLEKWLIFAAERMIVGEPMLLSYVQ